MLQRGGIGFPGVAFFPPVIAGGGLALRRKPRDHVSAIAVRLDELLLPLLCLLRIAQLLVDMAQAVDMEVFHGFGLHIANY